jgi:FAD/FMN-containing dehydrogenase
VNAHAERMAGLLAEVSAFREGPDRGEDAAPTSLAGVAKSTSNLFRERQRRTRPRIDLSRFNHVLSVDPATGTVEAEGMITYVDLADATLAHGVMPCVVPQLKSITLGGAVAGVGIEASSFRHGLVHETIRALEILTPDGEVVLATPDNGHRDLFFGFPNSYGTLGYALRIVARTLPVKRYVHLRHVRYEDAGRCFADLARHCAEQSLDFLDGTVFGPHEMYLTLGRFTDEAPAVSDYTYARIFYRSLRERDEDHLTTRDYLWRWDTDWFWCSKQIAAQNPLVRRILGRERLNSVTYQKIMRWNNRWGFTRAWNRLRGLHPESVIQDVDIPIDRCDEFLRFLLAEIGILPIWLCPIRSPDPATHFPLYPTRGDTIYVNFGFWDVIRERAPHGHGHYNRRIERKVSELSGIKSLYSDSYFERDEFWRIYDRDAYAALKRRYDPRRRQPDLYEKCVLRA